VGGGNSLLFNGHLDTNPVSEGWTLDPRAGKVDERFIYGIGVAGDAAYYCALSTLVRAGVRLKGDVVSYVVGELQGGVGTLSLIEQGVRADYFINCEPTDLSGSRSPEPAAINRVHVGGCMAPSAANCRHHAPRKSPTMCA
jgi:acetylornithine deacetylase